MLVIGGGKSVCAKDAQKHCCGAACSCVFCFSPTAGLIPVGDSRLLGGFVGRALGVADHLALVV